MSEAEPRASTPQPDTVAAADAQPGSVAPRTARRRRLVAIVVGLIGAVAVVAIILSLVLLEPRPEPRAVPSLSATATTPASPTPRATPAPTPTPTPTFDRAALSNDDPTSLWVVSDKLRPLNPVDFEPADLVEVPVPYVNQPFMRAEAADAVVAMFAAFTAESGGLQMQSQSAYRSYSTQESVYAGWVASLGQAGADLTSARPGTSEHQTGLAIDVSALPADCSLDQCFSGTPQGQWLAGEAWRFGFIVRYQNGKTDVTGYEYEPWHMRYVGLELAAELHDTGVASLEEFFGLPAAPTYAE